ncbi:pentatricopeptide repeat-containing protein at3g49240 [Phtheirospermum japonicum]|uniref:Pentatricopeptide repeat-containing protein at3g49240 n=1 Tax=Phtheirospermum japonicum TaxID=374723 RepID=A0A830B9G8_9LAMI|nr:pentatricopeptide repeat-containing protein at3g49240 [Phtheirospermum japonicum]
MAAQLRQSKYAELLSLHRFITQAGVAANVVTYNLLLSVYLDCRKTDLALEQYKQLINDAPFNPSPTTYRILIKGLVDNNQVEKALELKDDMDSKGMGEKRCSPDTLSYNVLIDQLCSNEKFAEAEELYKGMADNRVKPDEYTFVTLMDTCLKENRPDDAAQYFKTMVESKLRPNLGVYNRLMEALVKVGKIDEAKSVFDLMVPKLKMNDDAYKFIMNALFENGKHDEVLGIVGRILKEDADELTEEVEEFIREGLRKEGREDELSNVKSELEREKAEIAAKAAEKTERAKAGAREAVSSLFPSKLLKGNNDNKENENKDGEEGLTEDSAEIEAVNENGEGGSNGVSEQAAA